MKKVGEKMSIGQKIYDLRVNAGISQEQLAEKISVSRQSVSKWELDQALPQIDKVLLICDLFNVSTDELLQEKISIKTTAKDNTKSLNQNGHYRPAARYCRPACGQYRSKVGSWKCLSHADPDWKCP